MAYQHRNGIGALFRNDQRGNERAPRYRGELVINGTSYELAAWINEGTKGNFLRLSAKVKQMPTDRDGSHPRSDMPF